MTSYIEKHLTFDNVPSTYQVIDYSFSQYTYYPVANTVTGEVEGGMGRSKRCKQAPGMDYQRHFAEEWLVKLWIRMSGD